MGDDAVLRVERLHLTRSGSHVLRDIDVTFQRGTCNVIVGPSGAGKTSLLRCLNGLDRPDSGRILLDGVDIEQLESTELRRRVGMIFQVPVVFSGSVLDNLLYETDADRKAAGGALELAGLDRAFLERPSVRLSQGEAQRVCIARALVRDPEVLLMDEPTASLDRDAAVQVERTVSLLVEEGLTVVFVTHDLAQAQRVGESSIALGDDGVVRYQGPATELERVWRGHSA